jgi:hypothetical protein
MVVVSPVRLRGVAGNAPTLMTVLVLVMAEPFAFCKAAPDEQLSSWLEVREHTVCEAMQDDYCLGRFGFAIERDGTFIAGPSSDGIKTEGRIEPSELRSLGNLIDQLDPDPSKWKKICIPGGLPGTKDQVDVTFRDGAVARVYDSGTIVGKICHLDTWDNVQRLHVYLRELMTRYYPVPFSRK